MDYECFDFSPFGLNHQISNLLEFLNTLDHIEGETEAFEHFLPVFPKAAKDVVESFLHSWPKTKQHVGQQPALL